MTIEHKTWCAKIIAINAECPFTVRCDCVERKGRKNTKKSPQVELPFRTAIDDSKGITQRHEISGNASHVSVSGAEDWSYDGKRPDNGAIDLRDGSSK